MGAETVPDHENIADEAVAVNEEALEQEVSQGEAEPAHKEERVPLSALQKERKKRQEAEEELKIYRERQLQELKAKAPVEDDSKYESATKEDLANLSSKSFGQLKSEIGLNKIQKKPKLLMKD